MFLKLSRENKEDCISPDGICDYDILKKSGLLKRMVKFGVISYILFLGIIGPVNFFVGSAIGGTDIGYKYTGLSLGLGLIFAGFAIPFIGILVAFYFPQISNTLMVMFGLSSNIWTDVFIVGLLLIFGIVVYVFVTCWSIYAIHSYMKRRDNIRF